jgi:hypothetical protein
VLITFRNAKWFGVSHDEGTPIGIEAGRIKSVVIQDKCVMVEVDEAKNQSLLVVTCESQAAAITEQQRIINDCNRKNDADRELSEEALREYRRIRPSNQQTPRFITVEECHDGQLSFGEVGKDNETYETTVGGDVLQAIEKHVLLNRHGGLVIVGGFEYRVTFDPWAF